nr:hypothetical protein [Solirubrobacterales bacterium]
MASGTTWLRALATALHGAGLPYGYAITVWSTGTVLVDAYGPASVGHVFLFAAGATSAYGCLRFLTETVEGEAGTALTRSPHLVRAGAIHVLAIVLAITAAALIAQIDRTVSWPLAPFAATVLYLSVSSLEMALLARERERKEHD